MVLSQSIYVHAREFININTVSVGTGLIKGLQDFSEKHAFYPELGIGGRCIASYLNWKVHWEYWNDGVDVPLSVRDAPTYSFSSHIVGIRLTCLTKKALPGFLIPVDPSIGISHHFINAEYVGGTDIGGRPGKDFTGSVTSCDLGFETGYNVDEYIRFNVGVMYYFPIGETKDKSFEKSRSSFGFGFNYTFR